MQPIEITLKRLLSDQAIGNSTLAEAARYSVFSGGKRLRPRLLLSIAELYNVPIEHALEPAAALEMIHSYSLIHDDLPCLDNDDWRRGKPSLHKAYSESIALLTGDLLLTYAFEVLGSASYLTDYQKIMLLQTLTKRIGSKGMIGGQERDLFWTGKTVPWPELQHIQASKTAALIAASFEFGGIIANAPELPLLTEIGFAVGAAFQYIDDLADQDDIDKGRPNSTAIIGVDEVQKLLISLQQQIETNIALLNRPATALLSLLEECLWDPSIRKALS